MEVGEWSSWPPALRDLPTSGWGLSPSFYLLRIGQRGKGGHRAWWLVEREQRWTLEDLGSSLSSAARQPRTLSFWEPPIPRRQQG